MGLSIMGRHVRVFVAKWLKMLKLWRYLSCKINFFFSLFNKKAMILELQVTFTISSHEVLTPILPYSDRWKLWASHKQFVIHFDLFSRFFLVTVRLFSAFRKKLNFVLWSGIFQLQNLVIFYSTKVVGQKMFLPFNA